jgi:hypothetical protein
MLLLIVPCYLAGAHILRWWLDASTKVKESLGKFEVAVAANTLGFTFAIAFSSFFRAFLLPTGNLFMFPIFICELLLARRLVSLLDSAKEATGGTGRLITAVALQVTEESMAVAVGFAWLAQFHVLYTIVVYYLWSRDPPTDDDSNFLDASGGGSSFYQDDDDYDDQTSDIEKQGALNANQQISAGGWFVFVALLAVCTSACLGARLQRTEEEDLLQRRGRGFWLRCCYKAKDGAPEADSNNDTPPSLPDGLPGGDLVSDSAGGACNQISNPNPISPDESLGSTCNQVSTPNPISSHESTPNQVSDPNPILPEDGHDSTCNQVSSPNLVLPDDSDIEGSRHSDATVTWLRRRKKTRHGLVVYRRALALAVGFAAEKVMGEVIEATVSDNGNSDDIKLILRAAIASGVLLGLYCLNRTKREHKLKKKAAKARRSQLSFAPLSGDHSTLVTSTTNLCAELESGTYLANPLLDVPGSPGRQSIDRTGQQRTGETEEETFSEYSSTDSEDEEID